MLSFSHDVQTSKLFHHGDISASDEIAKQYLYRSAIDALIFLSECSELTSSNNQHGPACRSCADPMCAFGAESMHLHSIVRPASTLGLLSDQPFSDDFAYILPQTPTCMPYGPGLWVATLY